MELPKDLGDVTTRLQLMEDPGAVDQPQNKQNAELLAVLLVRPSLLNLIFLAN